MDSKRRVNHVQIGENLMYHFFIALVLFSLMVVALFGWYIYTIWLVLKPEYTSQKDAETYLIRDKYNNRFAVTPEEIIFLPLRDGDEPYCGLSDYTEMGWRGLFGGFGLLYLSEKWLSRIVFAMAKYAYKRHGKKPNFLKRLLSSLMEP